MNFKNCDYDDFKTDQFDMLLEYKMAYNGVKMKFSTLFTDIDLKQIESLKNSNQDINKLKILLANKATAMLHGSKAAKDSELTAQKTFGDKSIGKNLPMIKIKKNIILSKTLFFECSVYKCF